MAITARWLWTLLCLLSLWISTATAGQYGFQAFYWCWNLAGLPDWCKPQAALFTQKAVHVAVFVSLGMMAVTNRGRVLAAAIICGLALSIASEWVQTLANSRSPSWRDVLLNAASFAAGLFLLRVSRAIRDLSSSECR
jgi:VanZ family protein